MTARPLWTNAMPWKKKWRRRILYTTGGRTGSKILFSLLERSCATAIKFLLLGQQFFVQVLRLLFFHSQCFIWLLFTYICHLCKLNALSDRIPTRYTSASKHSQHQLVRCVRGQRWPRNNPLCTQFVLKATKCSDCGCVRVFVCTGVG